MVIARFCVCFGEFCFAKINVSPKNKKNQRPPSQPGMALLSGGGKLPILHFPLDKPELPPGSSQPIYETAPGRPAAGFANRRALAWATYDF